MKKNIRIMIITVAAVIILVAMLLILMNLPSSDGGGASSTASSTSISLNTKTADDVSKVEVKNNSDSYTVEMKSEDSYSVEGLDGFDLNKTSISALKSDSAGVAATQLVEEQAEDLSIYGLDSPKAEATITYKDRETLSLAVGNEAAGDAGTYVTVNGESKVYLFNSAKVDTFAYPLLEYVSKEITPSQEEAVAAANGGTCDENDSFQSYVDANPSVGAGPYQITAYTSGSEVLLEKYADATVQTGYVDKFIIKNIADANTPADKILGTAQMGDKVIAAL